MQYNHHLSNKMKMKNKMAQDKSICYESKCYKTCIHSTIQKKLLKQTSYVQNEVDLVIEGEKSSYS